MAVRGTIFTVTTRENPDGSYTTTVYTSEGKVSVQLLDKNGAPKGKEVYVPAGVAVTIRTDVNIETGNPAGVDGDSYFVFPNDDGSFTECGNSDPVYYPNGKTSAEAQTETTVTTDTERLETTTAVSEAESTFTAVPAYEAVLPVSDIPTVTTVPPESSESKPVIPSEIASSTETSAATTTTAPETTAAKTQRSEQTTAAFSEKTTAAATSVSAETTTFYPVTMPPIYTYPPIVTVPTTVPTTTTVPITTAVTTTTTEPTTTTVPTETTPTQPTAYRVSFTDGNGNVISEAEFDENDTLGTLPPIADKKGYTGKWVCGGAEVTESTVISGDMNIEAVYTPMPVTVIIEGPYGTPDGSGTETILTFTVPYDGRLTDNDAGYDIERLSQMAYDHYADKTSLVYEVKSVYLGSELGSEVSDGTIITGDDVYITDGVLYCNIIFSFEVEPWW